MPVEILTRSDLISFKEELIEEMKTHFSNRPADQKKWLKSTEVRKLLKVSPGTLQNLRVNGTLPYTKVGGVIFYAYSDILKMLEANRRN